MKKITAVLLTILMVFSSFSVVSFAAETASFTVTYSDGTASTTADTFDALVALANAKTDGTKVTATMNKDVTTTTRINTTVGVVLSKGANLSIDLNGHTLYFSQTDKDVNGIEVEGTFEVKNGKMEKTYGTSRYIIRGRVEQSTKAKITIDNVQMTSTGGAIGTTTGTQSGGCEITVKGSNTKIVCAGTALYTMRSKVTYNIEEDVGLITSSDSAGKIFQLQAGTFNIKGGKFRNTTAIKDTDWYEIANTKGYGTSNITGGNFPCDVSARLGERYYSNKIGKYEFVVETSTAAKTVGTISNRYNITNSANYTTADTYYKTLQYALDDTSKDTNVASGFVVPQNPAIVLLANNTEGAVANREVTITKNGFSANVTAGEGFKMEETDTLYVITKDASSTEPDPEPEIPSYPDGIVGMQDFENNPKYSSSAIADQIIGRGGQASVKGTTGLIEFENAHSGKYVAGVVKKQPYMSSGSYKIATSYRLKIYNIFGLKTRTPLVEGSEWPYGWEMFTKDDIGREFEISMWLYADSTDGAYPSSGKGATSADYGKITNVDVTNESTKPYMTVGLYGPGASTANDAQSYAYGGAPYDMYSKIVEWDTWTEFKINYKVTADTIYNSSVSSNTLVNAIAVNHQEPIGGYYPSTYYVDDIVVKELTMRPGISLVDSDTIKVDVKIPESKIDNTKNQMVIASVYDKATNNLISAASFGTVANDAMLCDLDVDFNASMTLKLFMWDGSKLVPLMSGVNSDIPSLDTLKQNVKIDRISQSFYGDVYTQKSFNWYSKNLATSDIAYVEKTGDTPNWANASYKRADSNYERYDDEILDFTATRQKVVLKNLKPDTTYFYKVGNKEFDVWSDSFTFQTADNTTNDAFFYLIADPQSSAYSVAKPKGKMMEYIYENHPNAEFILSSGDLVIERNYEQEWVDVFNVGSFANPNITFTGSPGDHDTNYAMKETSPNHFVEQPWSKHFNMPRVEGSSIGKVYYSIDYKDMHIAVIDTTMLDPVAKRDDEQIAWLIDDMQKTDKKWKIVITHEAIQTTSTKNLTTDTSKATYKLAKSLMPLATELGIDLFISGDRHLYTRTYPIYGLGGVLNETTGAVDEKYEDEPGLGNPDAKYIVKEFNGKETKLFDPSEGVTYLVLGSVSESEGAGYNADALDPTKVLIPCYDVVVKETGCDFATDFKDGIATYNTVTVKGDDLIISVYHFDLSHPELGGKLFDQFGLTKK